MSAKESNPPQENSITSSSQSPRDIRLKQIQTRNANLQSKLKQLDTHRQSLAAELRTVIANRESNIPKGEKEGEEEKQEKNKEEDQAQLDATTIATAQSIVQKHIRLLHDYNAIKDVGQGLFGLIADGRGVRLREIHEEFGVDDSD